jgi:hypothetical protein
MLDFGGRLSPEALRLLACDAAVVPIVMKWRRATPRRGPRAPHGSGRVAPRGGRPGPGMRPLRAPTVVVRGAPCRGLGGRWGDRAGQLRDALQNLPPADPLQRVAGPHPRRASGVPPTGLDRPGPTSQTKTPTGPRPRLTRQRGDPQLARTAPDEVRETNVETKALDGIGLEGSQARSPHNLRERGLRGNAERPDQLRQLPCRQQYRRRRPGYRQRVRPLDPQHAGGGFPPPIAVPGWRATGLPQLGVSCGPSDPAPTPATGPNRWEQSRVTPARRVVHGLAG